MPRDYILITDENSDLPPDYFQKNNLICIPMGYHVDGIEYSGYNDPDGFDQKTFYQKLREGADAKTIAISPDAFREVFSRYLAQDFDILYLAFSSGLSSTYQNALIARNELLEQHPNATILIVDSLQASLGEGLFVNYAVELKKQGLSIQEAAKQLEASRQQFCAYFTVDDLHFLHKGGRVSKTAAVVGSMLGIKPVLHVNQEGKLIPIGKVRGRKQSLNALVDKMEAKTVNTQNDIVYISHGDCEQDAKYVADLIKKKFGIKSFLIHYIGCSIGSHSGPGTVALFFRAHDRIENN